MKAIIFDFDGTLGDSKECGIHATKAAFEQQALPLPSEELIEHYMGIPIEKSFQEMAPNPLSEEELGDLISTFRSYYAQFESDYLNIFPGIKEMLEALKAQNLLLFVLSSKKSNVLTRNLESLEIASYFTEVIGSDKVTHYKPHPDGIIAILQTYHLSAQECLMVGDATFDIDMGKAASVKTCAVTWGSHSAEKLRTSQPDFMIDKAEQLIAIL